MEKYVIEIAEFYLKEGVDEKAFLEESVNMQNEFAEKQKGFMQRTLTREKNGNWMDIVLWERMEDAKAAMDASLKSQACGSWFQHISEENSKMRHFTVVQTF